MRRLLTGSVLGALGLALLAPVGCGGDQSWTVDSNWQGAAPIAQPGSTTLGDETHTLTPASQASQSDAQTWFGVRHDLSMKAGAPRTPACGCLAVEVGMPGKQAFQWDGQVPTIGPDATVVAISASGVPCAAEADEGKRRASISAVDRDGDDVLIEIEDLPEGRPLALGAIVPKPGPNGALYVQPRDSKVRWVPQGAAKKCRVRGPGAPSQGAAPSGAP